MKSGDRKPECGKAEAVCFRAVGGNVTREDADSIHLHVRVDCGKQITIAVSRELALSLSGDLEVAVQNREEARP